MDWNDISDQEIYETDVLNETKKLDKGYCKIWGYIERKDGSLKRSKIDIYTTGFVGSRIRNAETGKFYKHMVGSNDEDLYFKVSMTSEKLTSSNGSNKLFYLSPQHCMKHLHIELSDEIIENWNAKYINAQKSKKDDKK